MAKVPFSKFGLRVDEGIIDMFFAEQLFEVKSYISINEKLGIISRCIAEAADENAFSNPVKLEVYLGLEVMYAYTNISFTSKQKEDPVTLYDVIKSNGLLDQVINALGNEYDELFRHLKSCADAIYTYSNSARGIMESIASDYKDLDLDATKLQEKISNGENLGLVKDIVDKLG